MRALIVTGGAIQEDFAEEYLKQEKFDLTIASDSGMEFFYRMKAKPQYIVGDFDSAKPEILSWFRMQEGIEFREFCPEKDETDTELALSVAISSGAEEICVLGATGTRIDHVIGNIHLLCKPLQKKIPCCLIDQYNRICLIDTSVKLKKKEQFGTYVSLLPFTTEVTGITLKGFKYPLLDYTMTKDNSLGVSNEIIEDTAVIELKKGILIMIEARD